jgi:ABC-type multidrug transport system permease subunit
MFSSLLKKWKVSKKDLVLILCVFAITGFTTAYISKSITAWVGFTDNTHWSLRLLLRLLVLTFGYQVILLLVAFLLGQFPFFWRFEKKFLQRLGLMKAGKDTTSSKQ